MNDPTTLGNAVLVIITLGSFIALISKLTNPINDLTLEVRQLNTKLEYLIVDNDVHNNRLDKHSDKINDLYAKFQNLETKMDMYHKGDV